MKIAKYIKRIGVVAVMAAAVMATSCKEVDDTELAQRLFRPVNINLSSQENNITATWTAMEGAYGYKVELYVGDRQSDGLGNTYTNKVLVASEENIKTARWTVSGLEYETTYYFRVRANHAEPSYDSRFSGFEEIKTGSEIEVITAVVTDADRGVVTFSWQDGYNLTYLVLTDANGEEETIQINNADGQLVREGMAAGPYSVTAYNSSRSFNTYEFVIPVIKPVEPSEINYEGVILRWVSTSGLSRIEVVASADPSDVHVYNMSDIATAGENYLFIPASDLGKLVTYNATIWFESGTSGNTVSFTTKDVAPEGLITVSTVDELKTALETAADGATIAINPGTYLFLTELDEIANVSLQKSVTLIAATGETPIIQTKGLQVKNAADIGTIRLEGLEFDCAPAGDGGYLFDQQSAFNVDRIEIVNCRIYDLFNSVVRYDRQTAGGLKNLLIDNCLITNANGKQCIVAMGASGMKYNIESLTITNTTITNVGHTTTNTRFASLYGNDNMTTTFNNNTIVINSTTNNTIDYRGSSTGATGNGKFEMKNNIIYLKNSTESLYGKLPKLDGTTVDISGNFMNGQWVKSVSAGVITYDTEVWPGYGTTNADPQFADIESDNLTVGNSSVVAARAGDPRWLPAE